jgi:RNA recognition motif-containing protein
MSFRDEEVKEVFKEFGEIIEYRRSMNLARHKPSPFAFIRYPDEHSAWRAIEEHDNKYLWTNKISVTEGNKQQSYFTQDTGFITNEEFDVPKIPPPDFDSSLPENHWEMKRKADLKHNLDTFSVRIDDLDPHIT